MFHWKLTSTKKKKNFTNNMLNIVHVFKGRLIPWLPKSWIWAYSKFSELLGFTLCWPWQRKLIYLTCCFLSDSNLFKGRYPVEKIFLFLVGSEHIRDPWRNICILIICNNNNKHFRRKMKLNHLSDDT